jgi:hypothetical protein
MLLAFLEPLINCFVDHSLDVLRGHVFCQGWHDRQTGDDESPED